MLQEHAHTTNFTFNIEIHWALLGHMVSRNGGWNMTDLKGDLYTRILSEKDQFIFFSF